ncbi:MAG: carbohydrate ABC transporter permease [Clostridia bacterium]|nr:carbohydrate ABC transporter permease [Clostridia bacterium]
MIIGRGEKTFLVINTVFMFGLMLITLYPLLYVLFASLSDPVELGKATGLLLKPAGFSLRGYAAVLQSGNIWLGFRNTIFYVVVGTAASMALTILGAYPLSKKGLMLKKPIMLFIIFTMFFGGGMVPTFLVVQKLGLTNTIWAMIVPGMLSVYNLIVLRTSFEAVPESLYESAALDGANHLTMLLKITIPLSKAAIATIILFYAVGKWGEWYNALVYLQKRRDLYPLQMFLRELLVKQEDMDALLASSVGVNADSALLKEVIKYATIIVTTVPILAVYPFLQKYFVKGVLVGSVKE